MGDTMKQKTYLITKNKFLDDTEISGLLKSLSYDRDGLLIRLAILTGARASEILNIHTKDLSTNSVIIHGLKNSDDREIPLPPDFVQKLKAQSSRYKVFDIGYQRLNQIWQKYRPNKKTFHALRHTYAMQIYKQTKDLLLVQQALGHRSINNTTVYAKASNGQEQLKTAMIGLWLK